MVVFRVMATGFPFRSASGIRGWKPILRVCVNGIRQVDLFLQHVEGCSDVFAVKSVCPGRSSLTLQLGMLKKKSRGKTSWRMDLKIHQDVIQEDCLILTKWEKDAQKVNTLPGMQQMMFLNQSENVYGEADRSSTHSHGELEANQMALNIKDDLCVIPMPLDETAAKSVEIRKVNKEYISRCGEGTPFKNRTMVFPNHDVIIHNSWKQDSVCVTKVCTSVLYHRVPTLLGPPRAHSLPGLSLSPSSPRLSDSDSVIDLSNLFLEVPTTDAASRKHSRAVFDSRRVRDQRPGFRRRASRMFGSFGNKFKCCIAAPL